jgi:hypothetical protein
MARIMRAPRFTSTRRRRSFVLIRPAAPLRLSEAFADSVPNVRCGSPHFRLIIDEHEQVRRLAAEISAQLVDDVCTDVCARLIGLLIPMQNGLTVQSRCPETERARQWLCCNQAQLTVGLDSVLGRMSARGT